MKKTLYTLSAIAFLAVGCGGGTNNNNSANDNANETVNTANTTEVPKEASAKPTEYPNWQTNKGIGKKRSHTSEYKLVENSLTRKIKKAAKKMPTSSAGKKRNSFIKFQFSETKIRKTGNLSNKKLPFNT